MTMAQSPTVHVIDDESSVRTAIARLLDAAGYRVQVYASAGDYLLAHRGDEPGCIVLDLHMPGPNGLQLQDALARQTHALPVVFLTGYGDIPTSVRAIKAGAVDFLTKPVDRDALLDAISTALARDSRARAGGEQLEDWRRRFATLTAREAEVFEKVVAGKLNKVIAAELGTAERTVKAHRARVMEKMGAGSLAALVHLADAMQAAKRGD
jgi:FixJ family two-component response regulator